jgi:hypothetical protein
MKIQSKQQIKHHIPTLFPYLETQQPLERLQIKKTMAIY